MRPTRTLETAGAGTPAGVVAEGRGEVANPSPWRRLVDGVVTDPHAPLLAAVAGDGGSGKSTVLAAVRSAYLDAGADVLSARSLLAAGSVDPGSVAVVVDDAHTVPTPVLDRVRDLVEHPGARVVAAYRAWPRPAAIAGLERVARERGTHLQLGRLDWLEIARRASRHLGRSAPPSLVDHVLRVTGGVPGLVELVLTDCVGRRPVDLDGLVPVPWGLSVRVDAELGDADGPLRAMTLALALGATADVGTLAPVLACTPERTRELLGAARATGLVLDDGSLVPVARQAVLEGTPADRCADVLTTVIDVERSRGTGAVDLARRVGVLPLPVPALATLLEEAAGDVVGSDPAQAGELYAQAVDAGAPAPALAARRAECAALAGDLDVALRLADEVVARPGGPDTARAIHVTASALAHRGLLARSADVYGWLAEIAGPAAAPLEPLTRLGTGRPPGALGAPGDAPGAVRAAPPTLLAGAQHLMVRGVRESLEADGAGALPTLSQASALLRSTGRGTLLPDTPAALAALVALSSGESAHAEAVLDEALASGLGGPVARPRHRLLLGWSAMLRGHFDVARGHLAGAVRDRAELEPRDQLVHHALVVGIARRSNDLATLVRAWPAAREVVLRSRLDLFSLLPLGEIAVAAARLGESDQLAPHVIEADVLLDRVGRPVLWATPMHWYGVHAAILRERPDELQPHATALVKAAATSRYAALLADAGRVWLHVLAGKIDPGAVEHVGRRLADVGLGWDGSRLAGHAAARTTDHKVMVALMQLARDLHRPRTGPVRPETGEEPAPAAASTTESGGPQARLSERELEVARLVVAGHTYREISERLYISAKTVEHHVARMRQRLGVGSRAELLGHLRALVSPGS
ncbi:helix-turn-helix transcriptional regulator [Cellulomonas fimi]|uniref:Helix-turn-helix transcriptional regulator n=1 Tax=Cellulomonas fimi TaxID=1708 RepID=A0A7Y0QHZ0_CELFI|nr:helix-turn-helix transcriptional regulator [Cellulomonas fimi]NMR20790.1 helix-turn-helix transcriptional regulator [Cellulomonas fimi]